MGEPTRNPSKAEQLEFRPRGEYLFFSGDAAFSERAAVNAGSTFIPLVGGVPGVPGPLSHDESTEDLRDRVAAAMDQLRPGQRELLTLVFYEGRSISEIARAQNVSRQAVHKRFRKAKADLQTVISAFWGEYEHIKRGYRVTPQELLDQNKITQAEFVELMEITGGGHAED